MLRVFSRVAATEVEGPFVRFAVWVSGCTIRCAGCCNPEMFDGTAGRDVSVASLLDEIGDVEGVTVLGGEPLEQLPAVTELARGAGRRGLGVVVSTGLTARQAWSRPGFSALWEAIDTLVAGPFIAARREPASGRGTIGSSNQRLLHRTARYADARLWLRPRGAEVHLDEGGTARLVGDPRLVAAARRRLAHALRPATTKLLG